MVYRDRYLDGNGTLDERLYAQQDAQGNVTAVVNAAGAVVERYAYDAYGAAAAYSPTWVERTAGTQYGWRYFHQGLRFDAVDGLYDNRARVYAAGLMRFLQCDPISFAAGDQNTYRYVGNGPTGGIDPSGMQEPLDFARMRCAVCHGDSKGWVNLAASPYLASVAPAASKSGRRRRFFRSRSPSSEGSAAALARRLRSCVRLIAVSW